MARSHLLNSPATDKLCILPHLILGFSSKLPPHSEPIHLLKHSHRQTASDRTQIKHFGKLPSCKSWLPQNVCKEMLFISALIKCNAQNREEYLLYTQIPIMTYVISSYGLYMLVT